MWLRIVRLHETRTWTGLPQLPGHAERLHQEAAIAYKKEVKKRVEDDSPGLFRKREPPPGQLRAVTVVANGAAHSEKVVIPTNLRVT